MGCACQKKWLVVNSAGRIVHRDKTREAAQAVADRQDDAQLRVVHETEHRRQQAAAAAADRAARGVTARPAAPATRPQTLEVVTKDGRVLHTTASRPVADSVAARYAHLGATVRRTDDNQPATAGAS